MQQLTLFMPALNVQLEHILAIWECQIVKIVPLAIKLFQLAPQNAHYVSLGHLA